MTRALFAAILLSCVASSLAVAAPPPAQPPQGGTALPAWLAGTWAMERGAEWADEMWMSPRGNTMLGIARNGFGPDVQGWEAVRIERKADSLALVAQPKGGAPIVFGLSFVSAEAIEFANASQDFPQRIRYSRAGQLLTIEQSRMDGSDSVRTNYRPVQTAMD